MAVMSDSASSQSESGGAGSGIDVTGPSTGRHTGARPPLPNPRRVGTVGMLLFLAALFMLFAATMLFYVVLRLQLLNPERGPSPELGTLRLPALLWLSTFVIVVSSATLHYAGLSVALERQRAFRNGMLATCGLGYLFVLVQIPALVQLVQAQAAGFADENIRLYYLICFMVIVHGLHVIGGIVPLTVITIQAFRGRYDHEHHHPVTHLAMYWHFLDVVWVVMFSVLQLLG